MPTIEEHLESTRRLLLPLGVEAVKTTEAAGRVLADDVYAASDLPAFDNSQMDGYALSSQQCAATPGRFRVGPVIPAGTDPSTQYPEGIEGDVVPVMTGAKLPAGTAAVVPVEECRPGDFVTEGAVVSVPATQTGQFVRRRGSDIQSGELLLHAGGALTPAAVAVLVAQGVATVKVVARASMLIVTGGAEVGGSGSASIPDSNAPMLAALAARYGIVVAGFVRTDDDPTRLAADVRAAVAAHRPSFIVTSGGISAGAFEVVRQVLSPTGWFGHVDQQPGGPQGLARFDGVPVVCLPGNPLSTLVSFRLYVAPLVGTVDEPITARLSTAVTGLPDHREQLLRGRLHVEDATVVATPVRGASSHLLARSAEATCLIRIPAAASLVPGDVVTVYPL
ncbi:molybdopterin molybdotransferase MoeA [Corynebacterium uterequi]|uniref:Molybdopterin molybdenumtransferase n=1 Tax=Corynebacterium uterequi TaxID=1072256 RepID=A0A0G3HDY4_9CORY|nr:molybdopterin molybdotransferase MoeA [Corynebacterium uterequi]AKK10133.1 molybdopterin biosynthesis enzyme [Corynebacterium uterequi]